MGLCVLTTCIPSHAWPKAAVAVMERGVVGQARRGVGRRTTAWEKGSKSRSRRNEGCKKEGLGIEVISEDESSVKWPLLCVCVLGLNSFTVWGGTGVGGLDLET